MNRRSFLKVIAVGTGAGLLTRLPGIIRAEDQPFTVYLSFDDGPAADTTAKVLDVLKQYDVKATFFIQGSFVAKAQSVVKREFEEGHRLGSHLWDHSPEIMAGNKPSLELLMKRYQQWQDAIRAALGEDLWAQYDQLTPKILRWPGGAIHPFPLDDVITYNWNVSAGDDVLLKVTAPLIARNVLLAWPAQKKRYGAYAWGDGVIVLFHDTHHIDAEALPLIIEHLQAHGATFATLPRPGDLPGTMPLAIGAIPPCAQTLDNCAKEDSVYQPDPKK